jgi:hypothetical protein
MGFEEYTVSSQLNSSAGLTIDVPPGTVDGDFLLALYMHISPGISCPFPAGWTNDGFGITPGGGFGDGILGAAHRIASSEPTDYTWVHDGGITDNYVLGVIMRFTDLSTHIQDANGTGSSGVLPETESTPAITPDLPDSTRLLYVYEAFQGLDGSGGQECTYAPDASVDELLLEKIGGNTGMHSLSVCTELSPGGVRTYTYNGVVRTMEHASGYLSFLDTTPPPPNPRPAATIEIPQTKLVLKVLPNRLNDGTLDGVK